jgi:hypothetical protein
MNRCYNERGSRTNYVHSSIPDCTIRITLFFLCDKKHPTFCKPVLSTMLERLLYWYAGQPQRGQFVFSDKATFQLSGKVNHNNLIIWGLQNPNMCETVWKWMFCAVSRTQIYGQFFLANTTIMGHVYVDMLEYCLVPKLAVNSNLATKRGPSQLSQGCDTVPEPNIFKMMDRSWCLHSVATRISQSDTHGLFILGIT